MTPSELKILFRKVIKVVAGGPADKTRGAGLLQALDALVDSIAFLLQPGAVPREWSAAITDWRLNEECTYLVGGTVAFALAKQAGGPFPKPTGSEDAYWHPGAPPAPPTALDQAYPLSYAQYIASRNPDAVIIGRTHWLTGNWNSTGDATQVVSVLGVKGGFATSGTLLSGGVLNTVDVNVTAGTATASGSGGFGGLGPALSIDNSNGVAWDAGGRYQDFRSLTLTRSCGLYLPTNVPAGGSGFLRVFQDTTGGYALEAPAGATSYAPAGFSVPGGVNRLVALVGYVFDGTNFYWNIARY